MGGGKDVLDEKSIGGDVYFFGAILQKSSTNVLPGAPTSEMSS